MSRAHVATSLTAQVRGERARSIASAAAIAGRGAEARGVGCRLVAAAGLLAAAGCLAEEPETQRGAFDDIPLLLQIDLAEPPLFAAVRPEGLEWVQVPFDGTGKFEIAVDHAYEVLYVCTEGGAAVTQVVLSTRADGLARAIGCAPAAGPTPTVTVSGTMLQPGRVALGSTQRGTAAPWMFAFAVPRGTHDVIAYDGDRALIRRDLQVADDMALEPLDLAAGAELEKVPMRLTGVAGDEAVSSVTLWLTEHAASELVFDDATARVLPPSLLAAGDASGTIAYATAQRTVRSTLVRGLPDVFFPPRLEDGIELDDGGARWASLPTSQELWLRVRSATRELRIAATSSWLPGRRALRADLTMPGYRDEWRIARSSERRRELTAYLADGVSSFGYDVHAE